MENTENTKVEKTKKPVDPAKKKKRLIIAVAIIIALIVIVLSCADFITDLIWFGEVGYISVFLTEIVTKLKIGVPAVVIFTVIGIFVLSALKNNFLKKNEFKIEEESDKKAVRRIRNVLAVILAVFLSVILVSKLWFQMLEFFNYSSFGIKDPLFGNDVGFYMFRYEFLSGLADSAIMIIVAFLIVTVLFHSVLVGIATPTEERQRAPRQEEGFEFDPSNPLGSILKGFGSKIDDAKEDAAQSSIVVKGKAILKVALKEVVILGVLLVVDGYSITTYGLLCSVILLAAAVLGDRYGYLCA